MQANKAPDRTMRSAMQLLLQCDHTWRAPHRRSACRSADYGS